MSPINGVALRTLFLKEVRRFSKVWMQTVFSPLITTSLYFLVFGVALGDRIEQVGGVSYIEYVIPGLVMLSVITNSFLNSASSLFQQKINGTLIDLLVAPLGTVEILLSYVGAAMLRGTIVGTLVWLVAALFVGPRLHAPLVVLFFTLTVGCAFALLGLIAAIWAEKFDHLSLFPNFILTPLIFLGGVFYSVEMLPQPWSTLSRLNPILYMVNGLRHGMLDLGTHDVALSHCIGAVSLITVLALAVAWRMFESGYRLRS